MEKVVLPNHYTYLNCGSNKDQVEFRVKEFTDPSSAEAWVAEYAKISYTTWRVGRTYPNAGVKNIYRKDYRCQHSTDRRASGAGPSKHTSCPAKLEVIIKRHIEKSRARSVDPLTKDYPGVVLLKGDHNHPIHSADSLRHRDMSVETKNKLAELFRKGHNPSSALYSLKMDLMLSFDEDYYKIAADGRYMPSLSIVTNFFKKEFEADYGNFLGDPMFENLNTILKKYEESSGGKAKFCRTSDGNGYYVVICTPVMLRTHSKISQSSELVMLDSSGGMDKQRHRLYVFVTPTAAGGLPLGLIITDCERESVFLEALICYRDMLPKTAFYSEEYPKIFLTDNDMKERNVLTKVFPKSVLLLCQFHILKAMWSWLCNKKHDIDVNYRQELYFLFKKVVYSFTEAKTVENSALFIARAEELKYHNLSSHFSWMLSFKTNWISSYRKNLITRGNNTTNYVEIVFRIMKDIIFDRTLAYNLTQMVDFIVTKYEMYLKQRLIEFSNGRYTNSLLLKMLPQKCDYASTSVEPGCEEGHFKVLDDDKTYEVDMIRGICSCSLGRNGKLCKHASMVLLKLENCFTSFNVANSETKSRMLFVASGLEPDKEWFHPLAKVTNGTGITAQSAVSADQTNNACNLSETVDFAENIEEDGEMQVTDEEKATFDTFLQKIKSGLSSNPKVFVPAFKKMVKNIKKFTPTESGLVSAMHTLGVYSGVARVNSSSKQKAAKRIVHRCHKNKIGVQPTAIGRRKYPISGRRKLNVGRPTGMRAPSKELADHVYTTFGMLPSRKRKAPHNLEQCVLDNKSLGGTKHKKF